MRCRIGLMVAHTGNVVGGVKTSEGTERTAGIPDRCLRAVLEQLPAALWVAQENRIVFVNAAALRMLAAEDEAQVLGRAPDEFIHPDFHLVAQMRRRRVAQFGEAVAQTDERILRLDGTALNVQMTSRAITIERDQAVIATFIDTTAQRASARAERTARERYDLAVSAADLGMWHCDLPLDKLVWNDQIKRHFGLPVDAEVSIATFYERLHPEDREPVRQAIERALSTGEKYDVQYRTIGLDGITRWIRAIGHRVEAYGGNPARFDGITIDITRQKEIEEALRGNEQSYRDVLKREAASRNTAEMLNRVGALLAAELDMEKLVQAVTDIAMALTGAEHGAFLPRIDDQLAPVFSAGGIVRVDDIREDPRFGADIRLPGRPEAQSRAASYLAAPVVARSGELLGWLCFSHSERGMFTAEHERLAMGIAAQAAIAIDNARLFEQVKRERDKSEAAQRALEASNAELQQFAYVASHDLQEPLRTISSFTQLVEKRLGDSLDKDTREFMRFIVAGARQMSDVIQDLLSYSRLQNAGRPPARVELASALAQTLDNLRTTVEESGAEITYDDLPAVLGDEVHLVQLLQNLIGNAIKYRGDAPPRIHISSDRDGAFVRVCVSDSGIGIPPAYHERIFGIFKRLHGKDVPGTGIGLAICKRIVERHGGRIWVESDRGQGARFYFTAPAA